MDTIYVVDVWRRHVKKRYIARTEAEVTQLLDPPRGVPELEYFHVERLAVVDCEKAA